MQAVAQTSTARIPSLEPSSSSGAHNRCRLQAWCVVKAEKRLQLRIQFLVFCLTQPTLLSKSGKHDFGADQHSVSSSLKAVPFLTVNSWVPPSTANICIIMGFESNFGLKALKGFEGMRLLKSASAANDQVVLTKPKLRWCSSTTSGGACQTQTKVVPMEGYRRSLQD
eukprot:1157900-Pelagomonas_calceolata.AAC.21